MATDDRASYLETGDGGEFEGTDRLDLIRDVLTRAETWAEPPPGLFEGIAREPSPAETATTKVQGRSRALEPALAVAAVLAVALIGLVAYFGPEADEEAGLVVVMAGSELAPAARGEARLSETPSGWYIRMELKGLPPAPDGSFYEGWLWRDGEGVSIGTFHLRGGSDPVALWSGVSPHDFPSIRITLQDVGGGHGPSDRMMMGGTLLGD